MTKPSKYANISILVGMVAIRLPGVRIIAEKIDDDNIAIYAVHANPTVLSKADIKANVEPTWVTADMVVARLSYSHTYHRPETLCSCIVWEGNSWVGEKIGYPLYVWTRVNTALATLSFRLRLWLTSRN